MSITLNPELCIILKNENTGRGMATKSERQVISVLRLMPVLRARFQHAILICCFSEITDCWIHCLGCTFQVKCHARCGGACLQSSRRRAARLGSAWATYRDYSKSELPQKGTLCGEYSSSPCILHLGSCSAEAVGCLRGAVSEPFQLASPVMRCSPI